MPDRAVAAEPIVEVWLTAGLHHCDLDRLPDIDHGDDAAIQAAIRDPEVAEFLREHDTRGCHEHALDEGPRWGQVDGRAVWHVCDCTGYGPAVVIGAGEPPTLRLRREIASAVETLEDADDDLMYGGDPPLCDLMDEVRTHGVGAPEDILRRVLEAAAQFRAAHGGAE